MSVSDADNRNHPVEYALPAHADTSPVIGTDTRPAARRYFNTDAESVVVAVLEALARDGEIDPSVAVAAAREYRIDDVMAAPEQTSDPGVA